MKDLIKKALIEKVDLELKALEAAAQTTKDYVQDGDLKSDGKYDTRGIEAGYLAGAQMKRLEELKLEKQMLEEIPLGEFSAQDEIGIGALVEIELNGITRKYFLATTAGGTMLNIEGQGILVISVFSPIGDAIVDQKVGDEFELETPQGKRSYTIVSVS
jgi:transcription elongation GreA/GreB family factor